MTLTAEALTVTFSKPDGSLVHALDSVSFVIETGSFVALLGPSGSGKSTIVRVLAGLQKPTNGQTFLDGRPITEPSPQIGFMFQQANLMPWRTVRDNVALPLELAGEKRQRRYEQVEALLPLLGLEDFARAYPAELSGGMAQRVALGRILIEHPEVLLLDEPFSALDALTREALSLDLLRVWAQYQQTAVMVTHDINEAVLLADRILVLSQRPGRLIEDLLVPLDRPRTLDMIYTEAFVQTAKQVRQAIERA